MTKRIKVKDLSEFDAAPYLDSETAIAAYLTDILEANNPALLAAALGDIARARGMSEIAKASGITREALYKALRPDAQPRFDTISRVCAALHAQRRQVSHFPFVDSHVVFPRSNSATTRLTVEVDTQKASAMAVWVCPP